MGRIDNLAQRAGVTAQPATGPARDLEVGSGGAGAPSRTGLDLVAIAVGIGALAGAARLQGSARLALGVLGGVLGGVGALDLLLGSGRTSDTPPGDAPAPTPTPTHDHGAHDHGSPDPATWARPNNAYSPLVGDLLPNGFEEAPRYITIQPTVDGGRLLRFDSTVSNIGGGAMQVVGREDTRQVVFNAQGPRREVAMRGAFIVDPRPDHNHLHFDDFQRYELFAENADGSAGARVGQNDKVSFQITDVQQTRPELDPERRGRVDRSGYDNQVVQGISVGYADIYGAGLSGQSIDITNLPAGTYILRQTFDPHDRIAELDETNNTVETRLAIGNGTDSPAVLGSNHPVRDTSQTHAAVDRDERVLGDETDAIARASGKSRDDIRLIAYTLRQLLVRANVGGIDNVHLVRMAGIVAQTNATEANVIAAYAGMLHIDDPKLGIDDRLRLTGFVFALQTTPARVIATYIAEREQAGPEAAADHVVQLAANTLATPTR